LKFFFKMLAVCSRRPIWILGEICDRVYSYWCSVQFKACGEKFKIKAGSVVWSPENITIGNNFRSMGNLYMYGNEGEIFIGDSTSLNTNVIIGSSGGLIVIGNNVLIAANVVIRSADHGTRASSPIRDQPHTPGVIQIEDDVWIGSNAVITSNVTLAEGTIVAAGAVVTKSTEPYSIVGGVPARKISQRI
jgi:galactoside O-acetyltransferase